MSSSDAQSIVTDVRCPSCKTVWGSLRLLRHSRLYELPCQYCGQIFSLASALGLPRRNRIRPRRPRCVNCNRLLTEAALLRGEWVGFEQWFESFDGPDSREVFAHVADNCDELTMKELRTTGMVHFSVTVQPNERATVRVQPDGEVTVAKTTGAP